MATLWFAILAGMLTVYVVLDGFDLGAGAVHLLVAKTDAERRAVLSAIGPLWDGNEVWLVAAGGVLVFAFPRVYAAAFSGFYLPLTMALWLLVLRGISIEFRSHHESHLWRAFWDAVFACSSIAVTLVLGIALGNVVRGVPVDATGYFRAPLFTDLSPGRRPGAIDWYTLLVGLFALVALSAHGALFLRWKTTGAVQARSSLAARRLWLGVIIVGIAVTAATAGVAPSMFARLSERPWTVIFLVVIAAAIGATIGALRGRRELAAFLGSSAMLAGLLGATAAGLYPSLLPSTLDEGFTLDVDNAASAPTALGLGLWWWIPAIVLAVAYFAVLFRAFRGKAHAGTGHY